MSDTDDTDLLVHIPPNFFVVDTSDSESLGHPTPSYNQRSFEIDYRQDVERMVVNDLLNQVNNLENRICKIEQKETSDVNLFSESGGNSTPIANSTQFGGSLDSYRVSNLLQNSPNKFTPHLSLPSSLQSNALDREPLFNNSNSTNIQTNSTMSQVNTRSITKPSNISKNESNQSPGDPKKPTQPRYNTEMMEEIDQFLDNIKKTPQIRRSASGSTSDRLRQEYIYKCGELSSSVPDLNFGIRDFNSLPVREEPVVKKYFAPLEPKKPVEGVKHLNLPEVETLLKEMEETQSQIEKKLRMKEAQFGRGDGDKVSFPRRPSLCGDDIGSVPDLGYGIRDLKSDEAKDKRVPVHEDRVIKRSMSLCGVNPGESLINSGTLKNSTETNISKGFVPRRLELGGYSDSIPDLGFGLKSWYKSNEDEARTSRESSSQSSRPYVQGENPSSIPDLGFGLRNLWSSGPASVSDTSRPQGQPVSTEASCKKKVDFISESKPRDTSVFSEEYGAGRIDSSSSSTNLLSLSNLWGNQKAAVNYDLSDPSNFQQRLEEEKYRREHCERLILKLQARLLEEQQKLAVAVQVDTGKDQAIKHFQGAWSRLVSHWKELEEQRHDLALQLQTVREQHQSDITGTVEKLKRYESEISKALDLAYGYKKKSENLEVEKHEMEEKWREELDEMQAHVREHEKAVQLAKYESQQILQEREDHVNRIHQLEEDSKKDRTLLMNAKKELDKKSKTAELLETELTSVKEERGTLQASMKEERGRSSVLDQQLKALRAALEESRKKEKLLSDQIKGSANHADTMKSELRAFYQEQVEIVVRDKLAEFQNQLEEAEKSLRKELEQREQNITDVAAQQIKQVSEKFQQEMRLVEEKHREELQLYQMKLGQSTHHINKLQAKLKTYNSRKGEMAEKLHGVMENQWQQVLHILQGNKTQGANGANGFGTWPKHNGGPPPKDPDQSARSSIADEIPFGQEGQLTDRARQAEPDDDLKKQIEMLLRRPPVNYSAATNGQTASKPNDTRPSAKQMPNNANATKQPQWETVDQLAQQPTNRLNEPLTLAEYDFSKINGNSAPSKDVGRPPWK